MFLRPFQLVTGRQWKGTAFGGWKSRREVPRLVQSVMRGELSLDAYVTHSISDLGGVNDAIEALHSGNCLRAVVRIAENPIKPDNKPTLKGNVKLEGGRLQQVTHFSESTQCNMTFSVFLPTRRMRLDPDPPVLIYLSGLTCTDENARTKAAFAQEAARFGLAVVFPDTSPRGLGLPGEVSEPALTTSDTWCRDKL